MGRRVRRQRDRDPTRSSRTPTPTGSPGAGARPLLPPRDRGAPVAHRFRLPTRPRVSCGVLSALSRSAMTRRLNPSREARRCAGSSRSRPAPGRRSFASGFAHQTGAAFIRPTCDWGGEFLYDLTTWAPPLDPDPSSGGSTNYAPPAPSPIERVRRVHVRRLDPHPKQVRRMKEVSHRVRTIAKLTCGA